jgi:hypothetical protein
MEDLIALGEGPPAGRSSSSKYEFLLFLVATWIRIHTDPHRWHGGMYGTVRALEEGGEEREDPGMEEGMVGDDLVQEGEVQRAVVAVQREVVRLRHDALHPSVKRAAGGLFFLF